MILDDTAARLDALMAFHRRVERHLATLASLPARLAAGGASPQTCVDAQALLDCFDRECSRRHAEEERCLWPLLEKRLQDDSQRARFQAVRHSLAAQHRDLERAWREVRRPLHAIAEGFSRPLEPDAIFHMRALFAAHIHAEEAALYRVVACGARSGGRHGNVMEPSPS